MMTVVLLQLIETECVVGTRFRRCRSF